MHSIRTISCKLQVAEEQAADVVDQLMAFTQRAERSGFAALEVDALIDTVAELCRDTFDKKIGLSIDVQDGLPAVLGDANELEQVLLNLCLNARDALEEVADRPLLLQIAAGVVNSAPQVGSGGEASREYICIKVVDNGTGMDKATQARIFEPFFTICV